MAVTLHPFRSRRLAEAGLDGAPVRSFKSDGRSAVWLVDAAAGPTVVKRFEFSPWRQRLWLALQRHPAQRELAWNRRLRDHDIPVVPLVDGGVEGAGLGGRAWLASPLHGTSLHHRLVEAKDDEARLDALLDAVAGLTIRLFAAGFGFRDLKPSNVVVDEDGTPRLIDVGSARRTRSPRRRARMLEVMDRRLDRVGVGADRRRRFGEQVRAGTTG